MKRIARFLLLAALIPLPAAAYHPYDRKVSQQEREAVARLAEKYRTWLQ